MKLSGGEIIVKYLVKKGVPYIAGIPGHGVLGLFDAVRQEEQAGNIKYIQVKHEQTAAGIADGYFRIKGEPLAVFASIGPGTLNLSIGLGTAYVDSSAFLALCGDTHTHMKGTGVLQEIERYQDSNILRSLEPLSKRSRRAESVKQLPKLIDRTYNDMLSGRKGPCVVALPMDIQAEGLDCDLTKFQTEPTAEFKPSVDNAAVDAALALMKTAKRPVILAGGGALYSKAGESIIKLAEKWGAAVVTTLAAKGTVAETHPQYCFHTGSKGTPVGIKVCSSADVILALGARFADETTCSYRKGASFNFPDTKLIHVDIDPREIGKNYAADVGVIGDLNDFLTKALEKCGKFNVNQKYLDEIKTLKADWAAYLEKNRSKKTERLTISKVVGILNETLPDNAIISTSSGNTQAQLFQEYCYKKPYRNLTTGGFSTMGWAVPAAMGAKLAEPSAPVIAFLGDGDFMMIMQELSTMAQYDIPVIVVLADNQGWMAIKDLQTDVLGKGAAFGNDFTAGGQVYSPDFAAMAEAFKIKAYRADDAQSVKKAVADAVKANKPALIHINVSREHPDTGGKAFGWWDVPIPSYMDEKRKAYEAQIKEETI